jgi:thiamine kinase-like enzyme
VTPLSEILQRLTAELGPVDGEPVALDGGITNRNYRVRFGERECVVRLPGRDTSLLGIDRRAERVANAAAAQLGIAPAVIAADERWLVTEYLAGAPIDGDRLRAAPDSAARALRAFHDSGTRLPVRFWVPELLERYAETVRERGGTLPEAYPEVQALVARIAAALPLSEPVPCHDDLLPGNLLARDDAPDRAVLVDWEYAGMGHRLFDLGNLAVNNDFDAGAEERLLTAYFGEPPGRRQAAALQLFKLVSDAREGAWGVVQRAISELDFDFDDYAAKHFARLLKAASDHRLQEHLDAATA